MLVLTRKAGERLLIGDDIIVTVLDSRGEGVRIGIDAPRGVKIQREEVVRAVAEANVQAVDASADETAGVEDRIKAALAAAAAAAAAGSAGAGLSTD